MWTTTIASTGFGRPVGLVLGQLRHYVLSEEAIERFPDLGDHESSTFPELAAEGRLRAFRHAGSG